ncbi:hypothetical protein PtA15_16A259 [Puccinia triticina]|uniref:SPX domain-containing protein n=1 Tax=Puccinia triticina TaxID=208348 RepID=A0ABY7D6X2_9BASI|nr:uncharacterized protein PtA15_16A259 [Puccinia triticina]WAQ92353.1 hypothetical protein PtA15_16A259 [Puccinia triticina]WAR64085.1 hypothetical protein PtB15_16B245 [Puccinia triticina]
MLSRFFLVLSSSFWLSCVLFGEGIDASIGRDSLEDIASCAKRPRLSGQFGAQPLSPKYLPPNSEKISIANPQKLHPPSGSDFGHYSTRPKSYDTPAERHELFEKLSKQFTEAAYPFNEIRVDQLIINWEKALEKIVLLHNDFEELSRFHKKLKVLYHNEHMFLTQKTKAIQKKQDIDKVAESMKHLEAMQENISILNQLKLLELGLYDDHFAYKKLMDELVPRFSERTYQNFAVFRAHAQKTLEDVGASVLDEAKILIVGGDHEAANSMLASAPNDLIRVTEMYAGFKVVDFLFNNQLIDRERLSYFFRDNYVAEHLVLYIHARIQQEKNYGIFHRQKSFTIVIGAETKKIINRIFRKKRATFWATK